MTILEDDLSGPTLIRPSTCPNQRASIDYVGEGLRLKTTGPCRDGEIIAGMLAVIRGLTMLDGEVRIESKAVSGIDRQRIGLDARVQPVRPGGVTSTESIPPAHAVAIEPGRGQGLGGVPGQGTTRRDISDLVSADAWNTIAIRLQGPNVWLLVNDQPILYYSDDSVDRGIFFFDIVRLSDGPRDFIADPNDTTEAAAVFRNLRVSALADGDPARMPTYQSP